VRVLSVWFDECLMWGPQGRQVQIGPARCASSHISLTLSSSHVREMSSASAAAETDVGYTV
jgi:hypothetical protein